MLSKKHKTNNAFTLIEVVVAMAILAAITASVLVVMNQCIEATIDSRIRMQAFEIARENMEKLLAATSVKEKAEFGISETNPAIEWETLVESFYESVTSRMWIRAVCSATYKDRNEEIQTIELTHWLTDVTRKQLTQILKQEQKERDFMAVYGEDAYKELGLDPPDQLPGDFSA